MYVYIYIYVCVCMCIYMRIYVVEGEEYECFLGPDTELPMVSTIYV